MSLVFLPVAGAGSSTLQHVALPALPAGHSTVCIADPGQMSHQLVFTAPPPATYDRSVVQTATKVGRVKTLNK